MSETNKNVVRRLLEEASNKSNVPMADERSLPRFTHTMTLRHPGKTPSKVKGPIRCHKCQLMCRDAEHYLSHACTSARSQVHGCR